MTLTAPTRHYVQVRFQKGPNCDVPLLESIVRKYCPLADKLDNSDREVMFHVSGTAELSSTMRELFLDIEQQSAYLGVTSIGVMVTTLEDILLGFVVAMPTFHESKFRAPRL